MRSRFGRIALRQLPFGMLLCGLAVWAYADGLGSADGGQIYRQLCQDCHTAREGRAADANRYSKLAGDAALVSWQYVAKIVLNGKNGMPAFGSPADQAPETRSVHLSDAQVARVINYVRSHIGNNLRGNVTEAQVSSLPHPSSATTTAVARRGT
jgi:mono/diheme cytochrome c family protein